MRSTKYWPEPVEAPETTGDFRDGRPRRTERRWESEERACSGVVKGVLWSSGSFKYCWELQSEMKVRRERVMEKREKVNDDAIVT